MQLLGGEGGISEGHVGAAQGWQFMVQKEQRMFLS